MTMRVVTYNLLVPVLAEEPGYYMKCRPEFLKIEYRWNLIRVQLENEIRSHNNTIICLQEVSGTLLPTLKAFFQQMRYTLFENLFSDRSIDYMGVAIAVPMVMPVTYNNAIKIGDHIRWTIQSHRADSSLSVWWNSLKNSMKDSPAKPSADPWEKAMSLNNVLVCLVVLIHGRPLLIGTYHMPCLYMMPDVMVIHSSAAKDLLFQLAAGHPFIFAGDFNFQPRDISYRALTERDFGRNILLPKVGDYAITYRFNTAQVLKSAYREKNGSEPNYTNFCSTRKSANFCATLDYIFFNGKLIVDEVLRLPHHPTGKSYPDRTHPSDHLMLAASFHFV